MEILITILLRIFLFLAGVVCLFWPIRVIAIIYGRSKSIVDKFGIDNLIDSKTKNTYKFASEHPEKFEGEYPWHVRIMRVTGMIMLIIFVVSFCGTIPSK